MSDATTTTPRELVDSWLGQLGRKVTVEDVLTAGSAQTRLLATTARAFVDAYSGSFEYLTELKARPQAGLTTRQIVGVLNCVQAENARRARPPVPARAAATPASDTAEWPKQSYYATPSRTGNNDLDFWRVDAPKSGRT
jgi:hypothetical protein